MIHSSKFAPLIYPVNGLGEPSNIDRAQGIDPSVTTNFQRIKEIGRLDTVGYVKKIPNVAYRMQQTEYGSFSFWRKITNKSDAVNTITLDDFKVTAFDFAAFATDDNGTFRGTIVYPYLRTAGFALNIGNPDATVERTFNFIGEQAITWKDTNPYYIYVTKVAGSGHDNQIDLSAHIPVIDPDVPLSKTVAEQYIFRVVQINAAGNIATTLNPTAGIADYTYSNSTHKITVNTLVTSGDTFKVWHTSLTQSQTFVPNDSDAAGINATSASIFLYVPGSGLPTDANYLFRIQSVSIDVSFTRADLKEIGNRNIVQLGINLNKVTVKLGRILEKFTIDEVIRGVAAGYGKIDVENLGVNMSLIVKIYSDDTKTNLLYGMIIPKLAPADISQGAAVNSYIKADATLDGESMTISNDNTQIGNFT